MFFWGVYFVAMFDIEAAERKEQERKKADEKEKLKQLYKIIEEEKEKKIKKFNKKIKQSMRRRCYKFVHICVNISLVIVTFPF